MPRVRIHDQLRSIHEKYANSVKQAIEPTKRIAVDDMQIDDPENDDNRRFVKGSDKEIRADQGVDYAKHKKRNWEERREDFVTTPERKHDPQEQAQRVADSYDHEFDIEDGIHRQHNTAALEMLTEEKKFNSQKWYTKTAEGKDEDVEEDIVQAEKRQAEMYEELDWSLLWADDTVNTDDKAGKWYGLKSMFNKLDAIHAELRYASHDTLIYVADHMEDENIGLYRAIAEWILMNSWRAEYAYYAMVHRQIRRENPDASDKRIEGLDWTIWKHTTNVEPWETKYVTIKDAKAVIWEELIGEKPSGERFRGYLEKIQDKRRAKAAKAEAAFMDRVCDPDRIVGLKIVNKFWFTEIDAMGCPDVLNAIGESTNPDYVCTQYLPGSCTDIEWVRNGVSHVDDIPIKDTESGDGVIKPRYDCVQVMLSAYAAELDAKVATKQVYQNHFDQLVAGKYRTKYRKWTQAYYDFFYVERVYDIWEDFCIERLWA